MAKRKRKNGVSSGEILAINYHLSTLRSRGFELDVILCELVPREPKQKAVFIQALKNVIEKNK